MIGSSSPLTVSLALCVAMMLCLRWGYRHGVRRRLEENRVQPLLMGAAVFGLYVLLLGVALHNASSHLDDKERLIVHEANAIQTAYVRIDLLEKRRQPELRRLFRRYLEARLSAYELIRGGGNPDRVIKQIRELQRQILLKANETNELAIRPAGVLVVSALNDMVDATTARLIGVGTILPNTILFLLFCSALVGAVIAGDIMGGGGGRNILISCLFSLLVAAATYTLLDLGGQDGRLARAQSAEQELRALHNSIRDGT